MTKECAEALRSALEYLRTGRLSEAEPILQQIVQRDSAQVEALGYLGGVQMAQGRFVEAESTFQRVLQLRPDAFEIQNDLGVTLAQQGRLDQAVACFRRVLESRPDYAQAYNNLGIVLAQQGKLFEAVRCYREALGRQADYAEAQSNLGLALAALGQLTEAIESQRRALEIKSDFVSAQNNLQAALAAREQLSNDLAAFRVGHWYTPDDAGAYNDLGLALQAQGKRTEAVASFQAALRLRPDFAEAYNNLGVAFKERGNAEEAAASLRQALALNPAFVEAHNNLGTLLESAGKLEEAGASYREALRLKPDLAEAHNNLAVVLNQQGKSAQALAHYRQALELKPDYPDALSNLGTMLTDQGNHAEGLACFERAVQLNPDHAEAHLHRAQAWLRGGDFARGWPEFEWRWRWNQFPPRPFRQPRWDGGALHGRTILLHAEQGLGDTLQFIRYAPFVKQCGGFVLVECSEFLAPLLATCPGVDQVVAYGSALPEFAVHAPLVSLPGILATTLATIPAHVPYLCADPDLVERWRSTLAATPGWRIGIAWQGNPKHTNDQHRSVPLALLAPLAKLKDVRLYSLQKGPGTEQLGVRDLFPIPDLGSHLQTFRDTAAVLKNLDLVVTVDSAVAHCAGALAVPVWVLLPVAADWRWLLDREESPWYPTMRLFRQEKPGDWEAVLSRVRTELCTQMAESSSARANGEREGTESVAATRASAGGGGIP